MPVLVQLEIEDEAAAGRDQLALIFDADLAFGENGQLALELLPRPDVVHGGKALPLQGHHVFVIAGPQRPDDQVLLEFFQVQFGHGIYFTRGELIRLLLTRSFSGCLH